MATKKHSNSEDSFFMDYIKANRRAMREVVGFEPTKVHASKKAYNRAADKRELQYLLNA